MHHLKLTAEQESILSSFIDHGANGLIQASGALEQLLEQIMSEVNVRCLELVDPKSVRELLRSTFEVMKLRHLKENELLSDAQFQVRLESVRRRTYQLSTG